MKMMTHFKATFNLLLNYQKSRAKVIYTKINPDEIRCVQVSMAIDKGINELMCHLNFFVPQISKFCD